MRAAAAILLASLAPGLLSGVESRPRESGLADIHRIYIDQLGGGKTSDQFRDMLIASLQNTSLFVLTENPDRADATLKGSGDDLIFTEERGSSDSIGVHANAGDGSSSRVSGSTLSSNQSLGIGVSDSESNHSQERKHEATGSVRLVTKDGDILWSTTQESNGGKFRSAMADVADKIVRQLADETRRMRELAAAVRNGPASGAQNSDVKPGPETTSNSPSASSPGGPR